MNGSTSDVWRWLKKHTEHFQCHLTGRVYCQTYLSPGFWSPEQMENGPRDNHLKLRGQPRPGQNGGPGQDQRLSPDRSWDSSPHSLPSLQSLCREREGGWGSRGTELVAGDMRCCVTSLVSMSPKEQTLRAAALPPDVLAGGLLAKLQTEHGCVLS